MTSTIKSKKQLEKDLFQVEGYDSKRRQYEEKMKQLLHERRQKKKNEEEQSPVSLNVNKKKRVRKEEQQHQQEEEGIVDDDVTMENEEGMQEMMDDSEEKESSRVVEGNGSNGVKSSNAMKKTSAKSFTVDKEDDLEYDVFHLMAFDKHPINKKQYNAKKQEYVLNLARDNVQLLMAKVFAQKTNSTEDGLFITMPKPTTRVPREKHIPKPKLPTKWEQFKKEKGLITRKKDKIVFDEATEEWRSTFGWKRAKDDKNEWIIPAKASDDLGSDPFIEKRRGKKKAMELQKKNEIANKRRQENFDNNIPGAIFMSNSKGIDSRNFKNRDKSKVEKTFDFASFSTASMGKFDKKLKAEPKKTGLKHARKEKIGGAQFSSTEKNTQKQVMNRVLKVSAARKKQIGDKANAVYQKESERGRRKDKKGQLMSGGKPHKMRKFTKRK